LFEHQLDFVLGAGKECVSPATLHTCFSATRAARRSLWRRQWCLHVLCMWAKRAGRSVIPAGAVGRAKPCSSAIQNRAPAQLPAALCWCAICVVRSFRACSTFDRPRRRSGGRDVPEASQKGCPRRDSNKRRHRIALRDPGHRLRTTCVLTAALPAISLNWVVQPTFGSWHHIVCTSQVVHWTCGARPQHAPVPSLSNLRAAACVACIFKSP